ncbi:protease HtpX [bacterium]|nr:protease HtpX [bacterium]
MLRIFLFMMTNVAVLLLVTIIFNILGLEKLFSQNGMGINLTGTLVMCAVMGMAGSFISLLMSKFIAKRSMRVQLITEPRTEKERWLVDTVTALSAKAGIKTPEIGIFPSQASNAFATGWNKNAALVAVSEGLLHRFTEEEAEAVMAHEIGHVANGDMITLTLIQGIVNTFVIFFARLIGTFVDRVVFKNERGGGIGYFATSLLAQMVLGILASVIVRWFSRWREFRADDAGATLASRRGMVNALKRLQAESGAAPASMPNEMAAFGISSSVKARFGELFMTHPPLQVRIQALEQAANN